MAQIYVIYLPGLVFGVVALHNKVNRLRLRFIIFLQYYGMRQHILQLFYILFIKIMNSNYIQIKLAITDCFLRLLLDLFVFKVNTCTRNALPLYFISLPMM